MFAVIKTGGKQYRVAAEDVLRVERLQAEPGAVVEFGEVLVVGGEAPLLGAPTVAGATVAGEVLDHGRGAKVIAFKKRRRKNSRRKRGHRQEYSLVRITEILTEGRRPSPTPPPRPVRTRGFEAAPVDEAASAGDAPPPDSGAMMAEAASAESGGSAAVDTALPEAAGPPAADPSASEAATEAGPGTSTPGA